MRPLLHVPRHPIRLARFGLPAAGAGDGDRPAVRDGRGAVPCSGGVAAHAFSPLNRPLSSSVGMALVCAGHAFGWPVREGRLAGDHRCARRRARERGGSDRDRPAGDVARRGARRRRGAPRPRAGGRRRDRGRPAAGARRARLPPLPPRPGRVQGRSRGRGRRALGQRGMPAGRHGARGRVAGGDRRRRGGTSTRADAEAPVRAGRPAVPGGPDAARPATFTRCGPTRTCRHGYAGDAAEEIVDQIERFAPGLRERVVGLATRGARRDRRLQPQLRRRRHHHRRQHPAPADDAAPARRSTRTRPASPACTSARRPRRPGAGAHGMCGYNAARAALAKL